MRSGEIWITQDEYSLYSSPVIIHSIKNDKVYFWAYDGEISGYINPSNLEEVPFELMREIFIREYEKKL